MHSVFNIDGRHGSNAILGNCPEGLSPPVDWPDGRASKLGAFVKSSGEKDDNEFRVGSVLWELVSG